MSFELPFHPLVSKWFNENYKNATLVQKEAWPLIAENKHVLAIAPTGSGKTLTGFLSALSNFATGSYDASKLSVLYISPLKALNEDIKRNLLFPLQGIKKTFESAGKTFPTLRVATRSGDSTQTERRHFLKSPPSIMALTPESLAILLLNPKAREHLSHVRCVILDEIHACLGTRRGAYLSCQIDRLNLVAGEFQRIALSATVNPREAAAEFAGGLKARIAGDPFSGYVKREVHIVAPAIEKKISFKVEFPSEIDEEIRQRQIQERIDNKIDRDDFGERYDAFISFALKRIEKNRSTLIYVDSRRRAERICYLLNQTRGEVIAFSHHGSLSKDIRRAAEKALAEGSIPCVVATSSLELGIDIGSVDEVILAGSPFSSSSALQRIGRSGHSVGEESRGILFPFHGLDLLSSAAISGAVEERELEESSSIDNPLDVLAQIILALCAEGDRYEDELFAIVQGFYVFKTLPRTAFDAVVIMLTGAYGEKHENPKRLRELPRRLYRDSETGLLTLTSGTQTMLYTSGGVIANRGHFSMRLAGGSEDAGTRIGELDEEFVWERRIGDCFNFGGRSWRISAISAEAVEVFPLSRDSGFSPFWKADPLGRGKVLTRRILQLMEDFYREEKENNGNGINYLSKIKNLSSETVEALTSYLRAQIDFQKDIILTNHSNIAVEVIDDGATSVDARLIIIHSFRGMAVNYPLSLCLMGDLEENWNIRVETTVDNNAVMLRLPRSLPLTAEKTIRDSFERLGRNDNLEKSLSDTLASSGVFNAAFRESAEAALLIPRSPFGKRIPLWITRQKSKRLFDTVSTLKNFPIVTEALRSCLTERFDMYTFKELIQEVLEGSLLLNFFQTRRPSPFSRELVHLETGALLYEYDERRDLRRGILSERSSRGNSFSDLAIAQALIPGEAKPILDRELCHDFVARLRREKEGWAPEDSLSLCEWVKERVAIVTGKDEEWERLIKHIPDELKAELKKDPSLGARLHYVKRKDSGLELLIHRDWLKITEQSLEQLIEAALPQYFYSSGPLSLTRIKNIFAFSDAEAEGAISSLLEAESIVQGVLVEGEEEELYCDRENLELLFRLSRKKRREGIRERDGLLIIPLLAKRQGLLSNTVREKPTTVRKISDKVRMPWETLTAYPLAAKLWETEILPSRLETYREDIIDKEIREGRLIWYGTGKEKISFSPPLDLDLALPHTGAKQNENVFPHNLAPGFFDLPKTFWQIKDAWSSKEKINNAGIISALWKAVWETQLSSDSLEALRQGINKNFKTENIKEEAPEAEEVLNLNPFARSRSRLPRSIRERWKSGAPVPGNWFSLSEDTVQEDENNILYNDELVRHRIRLLIKRYGILCRPLLVNEQKNFSWSKLLPTARRMELSGELVAGHFLSGINSLQFASVTIARELEEAEREEGIYWMNAVDPASPCGITELTSLYSNSTLKLPPRSPSSRILFKGTKLIGVSIKNGKELYLDEELDKKLNREIINFISFARHREVKREKKIVIEKINDKRAVDSVFAESLKDNGFINDRGRLVLW